MPLATHLMTRRGLIGWALGASALCGRVYAFASDFWNKKAPADWSSDEVHTLLTKSPWAKSVTAEIAHSQNSHPSTSNPSNQTGIDNPRIGTSTNPNRANGGLGGMNSGGINPRTGMPRSTVSGGGGGTPHGAQQVKGIVRWESAKPIAEAAKSTIPDAFANSYVIAVINFPLGGKRSEDDDGQAKLSKSALEKIKAATKLTPKGKAEVRPGVAQVAGGFLMLGFAKDTLPLTVDDKEVEFVTVVGRMTIKARFNLKEMTYHDALAL